MPIVRAENELFFSPYVQLQGVEDLTFRIADGEEKLPTTLHALQFRLRLSERSSCVKDRSGTERQSGGGSNRHNSAVPAAAAAAAFAHLFWLYGTRTDDERQRTRARTTRHRGRANGVGHFL